MTTKLKNAAVFSLKKWKKFLGNLLKVILNKKSYAHTAAHCTASNWFVFILRIEKNREITQQLDFFSSFQKFYLPPCTGCIILKWTKLNGSEG